MGEKKMKERGKELNEKLKNYWEEKEKRMKEQEEKMLLDEKDRKRNLKQA